MSLSQFLSENQNQTPMELSNILNHLGENRDTYHYAVSPPIFQTSNFTFKDVASMRGAIKDELNTPFYTRGCNPTVAILRQKVAALEKAEDALIFGSGAAAASAAILFSLQQGDHVVAVSKPYSWTKKLLTNFLGRFGVEVTFIDGTNPENYIQATKENTKMFYLETPNSLTYEMQDLEFISQFAKSNNILTVVDNSYASPINLNPIEWGIDVVFHSGTKYLAGHSDAVCGVLCSSKEIIKQIFHSEFMTLGGIISPNDAFLLMRGLRTLPIRMKQISETTHKVVDYLSHHPMVEKIYWPFHESFPQKDLTHKYLKGSSGLFSITLKVEERQQIDDFADALQGFLLACSWGGHESLVFPIAALDDSPQYKNGGDVPWNLVRFNIGLEESEFLIADLEQAFNKIRVAVS